MGHRVDLRRMFKRLVLAVAVATAASFLVEGGLRLAIFHTGPARLANPEAYAEPLCGEGYWLLVHRADGWSGPRHMHPAGEWDRDLGWTIDVANRDESGAWYHPRPLLGDERPVAPLFGDSFMFGTTPDPARIAGHLQEKLPSHRVMNFAVGGYGLGQIVLAVERSLPELEAQDVFVGVLTTDLDRTILAVRSGPKPWFSVEEGRLLEHRDHLAQEPEAYFRRHRPPIRSYVVTRTRLTFARQIAARRGVELSCRVDEKTEIARLLLARLADSCDGRRCHLLLFHREEELEAEPGWREITIREACESNRLPIIDSREAMLALPAERRFQADRHPTAEANEKIATLLLRAVERKGDAHN